MKKPTQVLNVQVNIYKLTLYQHKLKVGFNSVQFVVFVQIPGLHCQSSCGVHMPHFGHICMEAPTWLHNCNFKF